MHAPTLLIGLGGLGSSIAQAVYARVPEERRAGVRVHILDTDVQELQDKRYRPLLAARCATQTSPPITVARCVERLADKTQVRRWFPGVRLRSPSLDEKLMPLGASQVRSVSRLALLDTLAAGRLDALNETLDSLQRADGFDLQRPVRVMIVNSVAGGTGSGCFLQLALYIRDYFATQMGVENVVMRGSWLMPEIFVKNGDYESEDQVANVRANGYAALKEFDAVVLARAGRLGALAPLELEFKPNSKDAAPVGPGKPPLDFVFLYDYTNTAGKNLGAKANYIEQAQDAIFLQLFSPLEGRAGVYSREDNLLLTLVASQDRARYASTAVAKLVYPCAEIVEYCALQWACAGLSNDWLEVDRLIREEFDQVERDRASGIDREKPDPRARFVELVDLKAGAQKPRLFYRAVHRDAHRVENNQVGEAKAALWLDAVDARLREVFEQTRAAAAQAMSPLVVEDLKDADQVVGQVERNERGLQAYREALSKGLPSLANLVVKEALWEDYQRGQDAERDNELHLNTWILGKSEPMHPLAARCFLCAAYLAVRAGLEELEPELGRQKNALDAYAASWDDPETPDVVETAASEALKRAGANWFSKVVKRDLARFADDYESRASGQEQAIGRFGLAQVRRDAMNLLLAHLDAMLNDWEAFFRQLRDVLDECRRELDQLERRHDSNANPAVVYALASKRHKQALWTELAGQRHLLDKTLSPEVAGQIYLSLYRRQGARHFDQPLAAGADWVARTFREQVVGWCRGELRQEPALDLDIKAASDKQLALDQARGEGVDLNADDFFLRQARRLESLAKPCLPVEEKDAAQFWCLHPQTYAALGEAQRQAALGGDPRADTAFSRHELACARLAYGLKATDLPAMRDPLGVYRRAYEERLALSRQIPPKSYTPHLDWRWDSPAYLPEVDEGRQARALYEMRLALLYALMLGRQSPVFLGQHDGRPVWLRPGEGGAFAPLAGLDGQPVAATLKGLYLGLAADYGWVAALLGRAGETEQSRGRSGQPLLIVEKLSATLDALLQGFAGEANAVEAENLRNALVAVLFEAVHERLFQAGRLPNTARQEAEALLRAGLAGCPALAAADGALAAVVEHLLQAALAERPAR